jgi:hypothetical protein
MPLELDHIFVCVKTEAPEAELLKAFGLKEGMRRIHRGQGTANVSFFFHNAYLELLYLFDEREIQSSVVRPLGLWERCRWREIHACPFGIALRKLTSSSCLPFSSWNYYAPFLPQGASIPIANNSNNHSEPLIFMAPITQKPVNLPLERRPSLNHQPKLKEITALRLTLPTQQNFSVEILKLVELGLLECDRGNNYKLEIEFDEGNEGKLQDFSSSLPIAIAW